MWLAVPIWSTVGPQIWPSSIMIEMHTEIEKCRRFYQIRLIDQAILQFGDATYVLGSP